MANVLNPEPESITLNTALETPTLEPATELEQPLQESTSNPETAETSELFAMDADAPTEPVAQAEPVVEATVEAAPPQAVAAEVQPQSEPVPQAETELAPQPEAASSVEVAPVAETPQKAAPHGEHGLESMDDFSAALEAFEREQAAEAAAVEAYGDKVVSGTVLKQTEKHLVVDVGLKSEGLVPIEQVVDHTGAVKFQAGDVIDVVIEREEPEGGYLVSYEKAQRLRVWDTIEKAANDKTPVLGTVVSRVKGGLTVDIGMKAFLPGSQLEIRP
ncbi:MAG: S1 RNA-binding domain-containing protein, partial [Terracidiphilus sp.]